MKKKAITGDVRLAVMGVVIFLFLASSIGLYFKVRDLKTATQKLCESSLSLAYYTEGFAHGVAASVKQLCTDTNTKYTLDIKIILADMKFEEARKKIEGAE